MKPTSLSIARWLLASALSAVCLTCVPRYAGAQFTLQTSGRLNTGYTSDSNPGAPDGGTDGYSEVSPALTLSFLSGRALHRVRYTFLGTIFYASSQASSYSNLLDWIMLLQLGQRSRLSFAANFTQGQQNSFALQGGFSGGPQPDGSTGFVSTVLDQGFETDISPLWSLRQTGQFSYFHVTTDDQAQPDTLLAQVGVSASRRWQRHRAELAMTATYTVNRALEVPPPVDVSFPADHLQFIAWTLGWLFDLDLAWSLQLRGGLIEASNNEDWGSLYVQPTVDGSLNFSRWGYSARFGCSYVLQPSLRTGGQTLRLWRIRLSGSIPLDGRHRPRWSLSASVGIDRFDEVVVHENQRADSAVAYLAELGANWRISRLLSASLRYLFNGQSEFVAVDQSVTQAFDVHSVIFGIQGQFPADQQRARPIPRGLSRRRVDDAMWNQLFDASPGQASSFEDPSRPQ